MGIKELKLLQDELFGLWDRVRKDARVRKKFLELLEKIERAAYWLEKRNELKPDFYEWLGIAYLRALEPKRALKMYKKGLRLAQKLDLKELAEKYESYIKEAKSSYALKRKYGKRYVARR